MDEKNGIVEAARVLGEEILRLNNEITLAGYRIENLQAENERLNRKLDSVKEYAASYAK